ncbi:MAG: RES family NAD+ phosphorylase [Victivallaceae bacterium]
MWNAKFCCPQCFDNQYIQTYIESNSKSSGACEFCLSEDQPLIDAQELLLIFTPLLELYDHGRGCSLASCLKRDWNIFSKNLALAMQNDLLDAIGGGGIKKNKFTLRGYDALLSTAQNEWDSFSRELKHINRFTVTEASSIEHLDRIKQFLDYLRLADPPKTLYRARICEDCNILSEDEMTRPPAKKATNGRANPQGISYLYTATHPDVAIHEIRPHVGAYVCIAKIDVLAPEALGIVDLRFAAPILSPFEMGDELDVFARELPFLKFLGHELAKPIVPHRADIDYLPMQYLCEFIKNIGYGGIAYRSSVCDETVSDYNIVLFQDKDICISERKNHVVTASKFSYIPSAI